jgi:imidazole glycerol phosphate synthase subunit HisF
VNEREHTKEMKYKVVITPKSPPTDEEKRNLTTLWQGMGSIEIFLKQLKDEGKLQEGDCARVYELKEEIVAMYKITGGCLTMEEMKK